MTPKQHVPVALLYVMLCALHPACGSESAPLPDLGHPAEVVDDSASQDLERRDLADFEPSTIPHDFLGAIAVVETLNALDGTARDGRISGSFLSSPDLHYLTVKAEEGPCVLWTFQSVFCADSGCEENLCLADGGCWSWPTTMGAGTLTVTGTKVGDVVMEDNVSHYYGFYDYQVKDYFDAGDSVTLTASGGEIKSFELAAQGVAPMTQSGWTLESDVDGLMHEITIPAGEDYTFTWVPHFSEDTIRLILNANNDCHGCPLEAKLVCESADTGALTVPKGLLAQMPDLRARFDGCPHSDCPASSLSRIREEYVETEAGWVGLVVESVIRFGVNHTH